MSIIKADSRKRRQLPMKGPLLFWRTGEDGTSKVGLVVVVNACQNAGCLCREVNLMVYRVDGQLFGVELKGGVIRFSFPKDSPMGGSEIENARVLFANLDLDTGHIEVAENAAADNRDESALAWLREEVDGQLLDHISNQVLRLKGLRPLDRMEVLDFRRKQLVAFNEAYVHGRIDAYVIDGRRLDVVDVYCVEPDCRCAEIRLAVQCGDRDVGSIVVDLASPDRPRFEGQPVLVQLWQGIRQRYPSLEVYGKRAAKMRAAGPSILAQAEAQRRAASPAIGRNQPCPCGSGKKYKRCCIGKTAQPPTI